MVLIRIAHAQEADLHSLQTVFCLVSKYALISAYQVFYEL